MSHESLRRNREHMGFGALTGLFRESQSQPSYTYTRDLERLRRWQQSNSESDTIQNMIFKYLSTALNIIQHLFIYKLTPQFNLLILKCKSIAKHLDTASLCVIIFAVITIFILLLSRFVVDINDTNHVHTNKPQTPLITEIIPTHRNIKPNDTVTSNTIYTYENDIIVEEYDTIDNLFKPTPIRLVDEREEINIDKESESDSVNETMFNEWILIHSVNWKYIGTQQFIKIKDIKTMKFSTAIVTNIDLSQMNIHITYTNCWLFCDEIIDIITSRRMIYLIQTDNSDALIDENSEKPHSDTSEEDNGNPQPFDPTNLYESIDDINTERSEFKSWVETQFTEMQNNNDELKEVLTDYLDDKMSKLFQILEHQQQTIQSIQYHQQNTHTNINDSIDEAANINIDWTEIEQKIDTKIESVVKVEMEQSFGKIAQELAHEIASEIASQTAENENEDILKGDDFIESSYSKKIDWTKRVVSHSKLKTNDGNILSEYGYWIMYNVLAKWNQQSILNSYKPGDCTPLLHDTGSGNDLHSYITIELYRPIYVKQISLFHYHSVVLSQRAINAVPKQFQVWGRYNLSTKWYDLGNFSYDYFGERDTQYFDVRDVNESGKSESENNFVNVNIDGMDGSEENGEIVNETSVVTNGNGNGSDDYLMGFKYIAFRLLSNYGGSDYACIYRLRVFGDIVS